MNLHRFSILAALLLASAQGCNSSRESFPPISRIAFGSCIRQDKPMPIFNSIVAANPEVMILLGDTVYGDTKDMAVLRGKYELLEKDPGFKALHAQTRLMGTWDDHDMGENDAGEEYPLKEESKQELLRVLNEPADSARRTHPGVYDSYLIGPRGKRVQIILLDTRWFRSPLKQVVEGKIKSYVPSDDANATVLGEAQWKWLEAQLKVPVEVRIIASSIQVLSNQHRFEKWANFPRERQRLLDLLDKYESRSVIFISGDRHTAEISQLDRKGKGPIVDVTSSSLNQGGSSGEEPNSFRVAGERFGKSNFGTIEIDWTSRPTTMAIRIRDESGESVRNLMINCD